MKTPILFFFMCMLIGAVSSSAIVKSPTDTTGTIGGTAKFVCEVNYEGGVPLLNWLFEKIIIYSYMDYTVTYPLGTNKYVVSDSHTKFTLEVRNLNFSDGGNYICEVTGQKKSAALIVLGWPILTQEPTNLMEGKNATFICEARFGGPSIDTIVSDHQPQMKLVLDDVYYQAKSKNSSKEFTIRKIYEIPMDDTMDTKHLNCEFGTAKSKENLISSTLVNVLYSVRNITYSPQQDKYEFGSNITCSAKGNPMPLYEWRNPEIVTKGQLLHIADDMKGKNSWTCTARNYFGDKMYADEITADFEAASNIAGNQPEDNYSVCNITYSPEEKKYEFGQKINCSAKGIPIPLFEWRNNAKPEMVIKGQILHITDDMEGKNSWTCTARNSVGGQMYEDDITARFEAASNINELNQQEKTPLWMIIFLIAAGCIAAGSLVYIALQKHRNYRKKEKNATAADYRFIISNTPDYLP